MTLAELKQKYNLGDGAQYEPFKDCTACKGTGEKFVKKQNRHTFCACLYIDHEFSNEAIGMLSEFAKRELAKLNKHDS